LGFQALLAALGVELGLAPLPLALGHIALERGDGFGLFGERATDGLVGFVGAAAGLLRAGGRLVGVARGQDRCLGGGAGALVGDKRHAALARQGVERSFGLGARILGGAPRLVGGVQRQQGLFLRVFGLLARAIRLAQSGLGTRLLEQGLL